MAGWTLRSILPGPPGTWVDMPTWNLINRIILPPQLGAICAMRIDLVGYQPLATWPLPPKTAR